MGVTDVFVSNKDLHAKIMFKKPYNTVGYKYNLYFKISLFLYIDDICIFSKGVFFSFEVLQ